MEVKDITEIIKALAPAGAPGYEYKIGKNFEVSEE